MTDKLAVITVYSLLIMCLAYTANTFYMDAIGVNLLELIRG
ncbi:hypothetical protein [Vibrio phage PhiImVa-1]|nr:hypothetical protein [Vibrio phage PhiImVa-1]